MFLFLIPGKHRHVFRGYKKGILGSNRLYIYFFVYKKVLICCSCARTWSNLFCCNCTYSRLLSLYFFYSHFTMLFYFFLRIKFIISDSVHLIFISLHLCWARYKSFCFLALPNISITFYGILFAFFCSLTLHFFITFLSL